jgi:hypothetical protein
MAENHLIVLDEKSDLDTIWNMCANYDYDDPSTVYYIYSNADLYSVGFCELEVKGPTFLGANGREYTVHKNKRVWFTPYKNYINGNFVFYSSTDVDFDVATCTGIYYQKIHLFRRLTAFS